MGANNGTGQPYWLKCAKCRLFSGSFVLRNRTGMNLVRTGHTKPLTAAQKGKGGSRVLMERHEYRCLDCGHIGWTRHCDILHKPLKEK